MFKRLFSAGAEKRNAYLIYQALVTQARKPELYEEMNVPDTIEGRFDMILLHLFLVDTRLEKEGTPFVRLRRFIQEAMVSDMDRSFRELGVGDMSVGKEMKKVGAAWLGRKAAYRDAFLSDKKEQNLEDVVQKNIYRGEALKEPQPLVKYIIKTYEHLETLKFEAAHTCKIRFQLSGSLES